MLKESLSNLCRGQQVLRNEPRLVGDIFDEMLRSNLPLAKGYRNHLAAIKNRKEECAYES